MTPGMKSQPILVTGATGLVGGAVVHRLLDEGASVKILARNPAKTAGLSARGALIQQGDMTDPTSLEEAVHGCSKVIHCAGVLGDEFKPLSYFRAVNVEGTRRLAEFALEHGVERFVHVSTVAVYGFDARADTTEDSPVHASGDFYSDTKLQGQRVILNLVRERGLPGVVVQPAQVYGPGDETWTLGPLRLIRAGKMILPGGGKGIVQPIFIEDLARGILAALERGRPGETYILCGPQAVTIREFFSRLAAMIGHAPMKSAPAWVALAVAALAEAGSKITGRPPRFTRSAVRFTLQETTFNGTKAEEELGFRAQTTLDRGMNAVSSWLERQEWGLRGDGSA
jgi:nucleoside-diphosphate-sugar epimerase